MQSNCDHPEVIERFEQGVAVVTEQKRQSVARCRSSHPPTNPDPDLRIPRSHRDHREKNPHTATGRWSRLSQSGVASFEPYQMGIPLRTRLGQWNRPCSSSRGLRLALGREPFFTSPHDDPGDSRADNDRKENDGPLPVRSAAHFGDGLFHDADTTCSVASSAMGSIRPPSVPVCRRGDALASWRPDAGARRAPRPTVDVASAASRLSPEDHGVTYIRLPRPRRVSVGDRRSDASWPIQPP